MRHPFTVLLTVLAVTGCASGPIARLGYGPFAKKELTTFQTPAKRMAEIEAIGERSTGQDTPDQQQFVVDLARRVQTEPDPLVRRSILRSVAKFRTPLAAQVLTAGLADDDAAVRIACCQALGERREAGALEPVAKALRDDPDFDVRVAATTALGRIGGAGATRALVPALEDRNPAMQFAALNAVEDLSGQRFEGDVNACLAYAKSGQAPPERPTSVAGRWFSWSPF